MSRTIRNRHQLRADTSVEDINAFSKRYGGRVREKFSVEKATAYRIEKRIKYFEEKRVVYYDLTGGSNFNSKTEKINLYDGIRGNGIIGLGTLAKAFTYSSKPELKEFGRLLLAYIKSKGGASNIANQKRNEETSDLDKILYTIENTPSLWAALCGIGGQPFFIQIRDANEDLKRAQREAIEEEVEKKRGDVTVAKKEVFDAYLDLDYALYVLEDMYEDDEELKELNAMLQALTVAFNTITKANKSRLENAKEDENGLPTDDEPNDQDDPNAGDLPNDDNPDDDEDLDDGRDS